MNLFPITNPLRFGSDWGFSENLTVRCNGSSPISCTGAGQGKPLLLLHGFPQNHMCWERVAPQVGTASRRHHTRSTRLWWRVKLHPMNLGILPHSKRTMAKDIADLLTRAWLYNVPMFWVMIEERGCLSFCARLPERVNKLGIIEIVPTADFWASWTADLVIAAYH